MLSGKLSLNISRFIYIKYSIYTVYLLYLISLFFNNKNSVLNEYLSTSLFFIIISSTFFFNSKYSLHFYIILLLSILWVYLIFYPFIGIYPYIILVYFKILVCTIFFHKHKIKLSQFLSFLNLVYLISFFMSLFVYLNLIPNIFYDPLFFKNPEFKIDFGFSSYYIMPSIQGSPASFSVFSALVFFFNFFYGKKNYLIIFITLLGILLTLRLTPVFASICGIIFYPLFRHKSFSILILVSVFFVFLLLLYGLLIDYSFIYQGVDYDLWSVSYVATHARTMIWVQQLKILIDNYSIIDYFFGNFSIGLFEVPHYQIWGEIRQDGLHGNPHNTFLLLFFRSPFLFVIFFIYFFLAVAKKHKQKSFFIIFIIFMACLTDSSIVSLGDPIFILILTYLLNYNYDDKSFSSPSRI